MFTLHHTSKRLDKFLKTIQKYILKPSLPLYIDGFSKPLSIFNVWKENLKEESPFDACGTPSAEISHVELYLFMHVFSRNVFLIIKNMKRDTTPEARTLCLSHTIPRTS